LSIYPGFHHTRHAAKQFLYPPRKHLSPADYDHVAAAPCKLESVATRLDHVSRGNLSGVTGELHQQFAVASRGKPHAAREFAAQPVRWKSRATVSHAKDLAKLRGGIDVRDLGAGKHLPRLLEERAIGHFPA
jgi:hypothetical protein